MRIPRNVTVHPGPSGRIFDTINRKLEEVEWLLNYARNANKPIPVAFASTTKKVNAPRRPTPMKLLNPVTHHRKTKSAYVPEINSEAGSDVAKVAIAIVCRYNRINPRILQWILASAGSEAVRTGSMGVIAQL